MDVRTNIQTSPQSVLTEAMRSLVVKYSKNLPGRRGDITTPGPSLGADVVLITGTTGSLGCHLLDVLISASEVHHVYALNRTSKDGTGLRERQASALIERGIDARILDSPKVVLLEGDLTKPDWDLPAEITIQIRNSVTHIIHNAWRIDMNSKLAAFESVIRGLRSLIDFALTSPRPSPPRLLFTSSMVILLNGPRDVLIPEAPIEPEVALSSGYSQSKWVAEQILYTAASVTALDPMIVRVGQVSGGQCGAWAANEWYPIMVQSATQLGCFPDDARPVNLIPFDIAAAAIADFRSASNATHTVHLVHPRPVSWRSIATVIASELSVVLVPLDDWLAKLEQSARSLPKNDKERKARLRELRAILLIPYFRSLTKAVTASRAALNWPDPDVTEAVKASPTLANPELRQIGAEDVRRWLEYWRKVGLLPKETMAHL